MLYPYQRIGVDFLKVHNGALLADEVGLWYNRIMPRIKTPMACKRCQKMFYRYGGNVRAKYCSVLCAAKINLTREHQQKAGRAGGLVTGTKTRRTGTKGYIKWFQRHEHRIVAEKMLGRKLEKGEIVHHKDHNKHNNNPDNLEVMTQSKHASIHLKEWWRKRKLGL